MKRASLNTGVEPGGQVHQRPAPTAPSPSVLLRPARPLTAPNLVALGIRVKEKGGTGRAAYTLLFLFPLL